MSGVREPGGPRRNIDDASLARDGVRKYNSAYLAGDREGLEIAGQFLYEWLGEQNTGRGAERAVILHARKRYTLAPEDYNPDLCSLKKAIADDYPRQLNDSGDRVAGTVLGMVSCDVPGQHLAYGSYLHTREARMPGVLLTEVSVEGDFEDPRAVVFVPFLYADILEFYDLTSTVDFSGEYEEVARELTSYCPYSGEATTVTPTHIATLQNVREYFRYAEHADEPHLVREELDTQSLRAEYLDYVDYFNLDIEGHLLENGICLRNPMLSDGTKLPYDEIIIPRDAADPSISFAAILEK